MMNKAETKKLQLEVLSSALNQLTNDEKYHLSEITSYQSRLDEMEEEEKKGHYYNNYIEESTVRKNYCSKLIALLEKEI